jgi:hypothetical protein
MRVLLYVEPVVFRENPLMLLPWVRWLARLVRSSSSLGTQEFGFASNPLLCEHMHSEVGSALAWTRSIRQREALLAFDFDRYSYAQDLFRSCRDAEANPGLMDVLFELKSSFRPELVISFTQNRYLRQVIGTPTLFWEVGPLPRGVTAESFFCDPIGHQTESLLVSHATEILNRRIGADRSEELQRVWRDLVELRILADERRSTLEAEVRARAQGRKVLLLALQPTDWLTYEGAWRAVSLSGLILGVLERLPSSYCACISYHPLQQLPPEIEELIHREFDNALFLPHPMRANMSELLLPSVDAVATITSSVGVQAALWGKPLVTLGRGQLSGLSRGDVARLEQAEPYSKRERLALFEFLTYRYCQPLWLLLDQPGYFEQFVATLSENQFSPKVFTDTTGWSAHETSIRFTR